MALDADELASEIQAQIPQAYLDVKNEPYPGDPDDPDQRVLYLAIARGILRHLRNHENDFMSQIGLSTGGGATVTHDVDDVDLEITGV